MKVKQALTDVKRLAFDTAPLIYLVEKHPIYHDFVYALMQPVASGHIAAYASLLALVEVLFIPIKQENHLLIAEYEQVLSTSRGFRMVGINTAIAKQTVELRVKYNLKTPDALHLATAIAMKCDAFVTNDLTFKKVSELKIILIDDLEPDSPTPESP